MVSSSHEQGGVWRSLRINDKAHVVRFTKENDSWKVILTDLVEIWIENLTHESMFRKCQTLNPLLKPLDAFDWKRLVMDMLNDIPEHVVEATACQIKLQKDMSLAKLKFSLDLVKGTPQQFWENVTMPFCLSSREMVRQHEILLDLVKKKDEEIAEYKARGAELIRKYIATKPFGEELFQVDAALPDATDLTKAFQLILNSCNATTSLKTQVKIEPEMSPNGESGDAPRIDGNELASSSKNLQEAKRDEFNKDAAKYEPNTSTGRSSILNLSNTSYSIQKSLKKKKKTLNDLIR